MVSEACCNSDRTQAVFPDPVIPAIMEVKGCSKRNRWHFCENTGTVWNGVRPAFRCLDITCLCKLSFRLKDFSQTEQNQFMSTPQEQNVDWERGRMLRIYIRFQAIKFYCFPPPTPLLRHFHCFPSPPPAPPPPRFCCFPSTTTTTTTCQLLSSTTTNNTTSFLLFSLHHHHHISIVFYPSFSTRLYKRLSTAILSSFCRNASCSKQQSWFSPAVSWLSYLSAPVSFKDSYSTTTTCTSPSLI